MLRTSGRVAEVQLHSGQASALIACQPDAIPAAGHYLLAIAEGSIQATQLYLADTWNQGFLAAPPYPKTWRPGTELTLFGPLGKGFKLPPDIRRLALIALGDTNARLLPLVKGASQNRYHVTLFSDAPLADIHPDLEAYPLDDLQEFPSWADFYVVDSPLISLNLLLELFRNPPQGLTAIRGQALVISPMPCSTLGDCGVCSVKIKRSWKLTCRDGPVFDLPGVLQGIT